MSSYSLIFFHQILLVMTNFQKVYDKVSNRLLDILNETKIYSVKHDLLNPFDKTYSNVFLPWLFISINYNRFTLGVSTDRYFFIKRNNNHIFYETYMIYNRTFTSIISNKEIKNVTKDFHSLPFIFTKIMKYDISKNISNILTDITLTANHICVLFKKDLMTPVTCHSDILETYVFKDIDIIK